LLGDRTFNYTINAPTNTPVPPTSTPVPTAAPTHTNVPGTSHAPTKTPTPSPTCAPVCTGKTCGDDACGGVCGTCLTGYSCGAAFSCIADPYFTEDEFLAEWDGIDNIGDVGLELGFEPGDIVLGPDGLSLGGFRFFGRTAPNVLLNLYIFSTPLIKTTTSDANGDWSITISEPLSAGDHTVYAVIVTNGVETKNSEIVAFNINPVSKIVALTDSIPVTPKPTATPVPTTTGSSTTLPIVLGIVALLVIGGLLIAFKKKGKKVNKKVEVGGELAEEHTKQEHEDEERKISSLGEDRE
jgi:LPXTG-motif cell wall-anchored protein